MLIIGLTGSIGMGKSTAAERFRHHGLPVFDADAAVHDLYRGALAGDIERAFPGTVTGGIVDRAKLSAELIAHPHRYQDLERLVHPRVRALEREFLNTAARSGAWAGVLEIPLLFETGADALVDTVVAVIASASIQRQRVLDRPGMSDSKLASILKRQTPDDEKRRRAEFVVDTSGSIPECHSQIDALLPMLKNQRGSAFERFWQQG